MGDFTIDYEPAAASQLVWAYVVYAADQAAVARAIDTITLALSTDPDTKGVPVSEGLRSYTFPPLKFLYSADESAGLVLVGSVHLVGRPV